MWRPLLINKNLLVIVVMSHLEVELRKVKGNMLTSKERMLQIIKEELFYREFYRGAREQQAPSKTKKPEDTKNENIKK